ncbi:MAG: amino acid adenylation domain-containing protein, partial [bacterium]|nr:amino acid adenylation domain-containing protein [bacterium]
SARDNHQRDPGKIEIYNEYGPTEATVGCMIHRYNPEEDNGITVPIGKPAANTQIYLLDKNKHPVAPGLTGEIYIAGKGLAIGYLNRPETTAQRFLPNPFQPGEKMYRTGDSGRWLPGGKIEYLGRTDQQVKIRGFRIEPGEIQYRLLAEETVKEALVSVKEDETNDKYLCAYIVPTHLESFEITALRETLAQKLPDYMIPPFFVTLKEIPLTDNGKIDRNALPEPEIQSHVPYVPPGNTIEEGLVEIWAGILGMQKEELGIDANFFEIGGHSLKATVLAAEIHKVFGVKISLVDIFEKFTIRGMAQCIANTKKEKYAPLEPVEKKEYYTLSAAQKRLYILQQMDLKSIGYNVSEIIPFGKNTGMEKIKETAARLIQRHESLGTTFQMIDDSPVQVIHQKADLKIKHFKIDTPEPEAGEREIREIFDNFRKPFDLAINPLIRIGILENIVTGSCTLMFDMHHIITDGVSMEILTKEFNEMYQGMDCSPLKIQYKDFSQWQNSPQQQNALKKQETYWTGLLAGELPVIQLQTDFKRPVIQSFEGDRVSFELEESATVQLKKIAGENDTTLYMTLLAIFNVLLSGLSGQEDIIVGTPIAARRHADLKGIVGMFVNTLAMRNYPAGTKTFKDFLQEVKGRTLKAFDNQEYQFEELVEKLSVRRDSSRNPVFDVLYDMMNQGEMNPGELEERDFTGISTEDTQRIKRTSKFDLTLKSQDYGKTLVFSIDYCIRLFKKETIRRYVDYFKTVVRQVVAGTGKKLMEIDLIDEDERERLLYSFNDKRVPYPRETIYQGFEKQVRKTPEAIAVVGRERQEKGGTPQKRCELTYAELKKKADYQAQILKQKGLQPGDIVGILMDNSSEIISAILATLAAGAAYMPISTDFPAQRIDYMLKDSNAKILLVPPNADGNYKAPPGTPLTLPVGNWEPQTGAELSQPTETQPAGNPLDPVYIIYTSGTTGQPRGVIIQNRNLVNYVNWFAGENGISGEDRAILTSSFAFDLGYTSIYPPLLKGGQLHIPPKKDYLNPAALLDYIEDNAITYLKMTPSLFSTIVHHPGISGEKLKNLRLAVLGGEPIEVNDIETAHRLCETLKIMNHYGPTEATIGCVVRLVDFSQLDHYRETPTIGKPITNNAVYILDRHLKLAPVGVAGELTVSGESVAAGYLNQPELTTEKFLNSETILSLADSSFPNNQYPITNNSLYRTGDRARWLPDGNIEFLGRIDSQVKIRGYRVEPGEIEKHMLTHPNIKEAVVIAKENQTRKKYLCAYIVTDTGTDTGTETGTENRRETGVQELKTYLSQRLPEYMIPLYITPLDRVPLTPNGKIDRRKLPEPDINTMDGYTPPANGVERKITAIWADVLGLEEEQIGIENNFFQLGGHSLKATIVITKIHKELEVRVPLAEMFKTPTIKEISAYIQKTAVEERYASIQPQEKKEYYPLSSSQNRLYLLQEMTQENTAYNLPRLITFPGDTDIKKLEEIAAKLIERHESLRTSFLLINGKTVQKIHENKTIHFEIEKYRFNRAEGETQEPAQIEKIVGEKIKPFNLAKAPLLRLTVMENPGENLHLLFDMHHIISDGTSRKIVTREFLEMWEGEQPEPLRLQYKDYAVWQNRSLEALFKKQENYWTRQFEHLPPQLQLPTDYNRPLLRSFEGACVQFVLDEKKSRNLKKITLDNGATLYMSILSIFNVLLSKISGQDDITVGTPVATRRHADLENIIGMFVNTIVMRNNPSNRKTFSMFLNEVKNRTLEAFENQEYRFEELVDKTSVPRDTARNPLFDVTYNMLNQMEHPENDTIEEEEKNDYTHKEVANKFDLSLISAEMGEKLHFKVEYCTEIFAPETIDRFIGYFKKILKTVTDNPKIEISQIDILPGHQKEKKINHFNEELKETNAAGTIQEKLLESFRRHSNKTALKTHNADITYAQLSAGSAAPAHWLIKNKIEKGTFVGIYTTDKIELITLMIAILRAGCVFVPLDPGLPIERIRYMLDSTGTPIVFSGKMNTEIAAHSKKRRGSIRVVTVEEENRPEENRNYNGSDNSYVYFTSGTTGKPKGIIGKNESLLQFIQWEIDTFHIDANTRFSQFSAIGFDAFLRDLFTPLCVGGTLCLPAVSQTMMKEEELIKWIENNEIHVIHCVPTLFRLFNSTSLAAASFPVLRYVLLSGEPIIPAEVAHWNNALDRPPQLVNFYGPTETTMIRTSYFISQEDGQKERIPIGKPIRGTRLILLNRSMNICDRGIAGEIYIRTPYRTSGYCNDPQLNLRNFIPNPFNNDPGDIIYKTGDLGRELEDGNVELLGREDRQVKIRGARVELEEIENTLTKIREIKHAAVTISETKDGEIFLNAYYLALQPEPERYLRKILTQTLPDYMIPTFFMRMDRFPLTNSGKVDHNALPDPRKSMTRKTGKELPENENETKIRSIWSQVLEIDEEKIGVSDDFFEMGGNSIRIIKVSNLIGKAFEIELSLTAFFLHTTIRSLAANISRQNKFKQLESVVLLNKGIAPENIFILHQLQGYVYPYRKLARLLEKKYNLLGIQPGKKLMRENNGKDLRKKLLTQYVNEIKKVQEEGPYIIAGYCVGNSIAYEVAKILEDMGETVAGLILINSRPFLQLYYTKYVRLKNNLLRILHPALSIHPIARTLKTQENKEPNAPETAEKKDVAGSEDHKNNLGPAEISLQFLRMFKRPCPGGVVNAPITIIRPRNEIRWQIPDKLWNRMSKGGVTIKRTDGNHHNIFNVPFVRGLAKIIITK